MTTTLADLNNTLEIVAGNTAATGSAVNKLLSKFGGGDQLEKSREAKQSSVFKNLGTFASRSTASSKGRGGSGGLFSGDLSNLFGGFTAGAFAGLLGKTALRALPGILVATMADEIVDELLDPDGTKLNPKTREMVIRSLEFGGLALIFGKRFVPIGLAIGALSKELEDPKYDKSLESIKESLNKVKVALFGETIDTPSGPVKKQGLLTNSLPFLLENVAIGMTGIAKIITGDILENDWWEQFKKGNFENIFDPELEKSWPQAIAVLGGMAVLMGAGGPFMRTLKFLAGFGIKSPIGRLLVLAAAGGAAAKFGFDRLTQYAAELGLIDEETANELREGGAGTAATVAGTGAAIYGGYKVNKAISNRMGGGGPKPDDLANAAEKDAKNKRLPKGITKDMADKADKMGLKFNSAGQLVEKNTGQYVKKEVADKFAKELAKKGLLKGLGVAGAAAIPFIGWMIGAGIAVYEIYEFTQGRGIYYDLYKYLNTKDREDILEDLVGAESRISTQKGRNLKGTVLSMISNLNRLREMDPDAYNTLYNAYKDRYFGKGISQFDSQFSKLPAPTVNDASTGDTNETGSGDINVGQIGSNNQVTTVNPIAMMDIGTGDKFGINTRTPNLHSTSAVG